ncbi:MAG: FecR domain-containing protein [Gammaproteobacteria bacterium]
MNPIIPRIISPLVLLLLTQFPAVVHAAAGKVVFAFGEAAAIGTDGVRRDLKRGSSIESGDTLRTLDGRMHVRFSDGGFVALQARTDFKVEDYNFSGTEDGSESAVFQLLNGGIRAITGLIGNRQKERFRMHTPVGTIGIRGTEFTALVCAGGSCVTPWGAVLRDGLYTRTAAGTIFVQNNAGIIDLPSGVGGFVPDLNTPPSETGAAPPVETSVITGETVADGSEGEDNGSTYVSGSQYGTGGAQSIVVGDVPVGDLGAPGSFIQFASPDQITVGGFTSARKDFSDGEIFTFVDGFAISSDARVFRSANNVSPPADQLATGLSAFALDNTGSTSDIVIERFSQGTVAFDFRFVDPAFAQFNGETSVTLTGNESFFAAYGRPANSIPALGNASYVFAGASKSATIGDGPLGIGAIDAQIDVNFTTAQVDLFYQVDHLGTFYSAFHSAEPLIHFDGAASTGYVFGAQGGVAFGGLGACSGGCASFVGGALNGNTPTVLGNTPAAAGFVYTIFDNNPVQGAVALKLDPTSVVP